LGAQRLRARIVLPVERRDDIGTANRGRVSGRVEPHPDVILVHRSELRVRRRVGERSIVYRGGRPRPGRNGEGLDAEPTYEDSVCVPGTIGFQVSLIPGDTERGVGQLVDEHVEIRVPW